MVSKWLQVPGISGRKELKLTTLFRYMPLEACEKMVGEGEVRVSASTTFLQDETLSETRRDDEESKNARAVVSELLGWHVPEGFELSATYEDEKTEGTLVNFQAGVRNPYWILSLSTDLTLELFEEFDEDAAVEILDLEEFLRRLQGASGHLLSRGESFKYDHVEYGDDYVAYGLTVVPLNPLFQKGPSYSCQKEYRVVWWPKRGAAQHDFLYLGGLEGIAQVVRKDQLTNRTREEIRFPDYAVEEYRRTHKPSARDRQLARLKQDLDDFASERERGRPTFDPRSETEQGSFHSVPPPPVETSPNKKTSRHD